jgi:transcriptional repressor NrdR
MNCIYCGGDTKVVNSRVQKRSNQVWRRRQCITCGAIFTTEETVHYETTWLIRGKSGEYTPFLPHKLVISLHRSLQHRPTSLSDAASLSQTTIKKLHGRFSNGSIDSAVIAQVAQVALNRFDVAASVHYQAHHQQRTG